MCWSGGVSSSERTARAPRRGARGARGGQALRGQLVDASMPEPARSFVGGARRGTPCDELLGDGESGHRWYHELRGSQPARAGTVLDCSACALCCRREVEAGVAM